MSIELQTKPFFSILVPVYNGEKYLEKCLESVLDQKFQDFEIIVCDDGSSDNTSNILDNYSKKEPRLRFFSHKENISLFVSRKDLIREAKGEYVAFVDVDDTIKKDFLKSAKKYLDRQKVDILAYQAYRPCLGWGKKLFSGREIFNFFCNYLSDFMPVWSKVYRKSFIIENLPADVDLFYGEDLLFNLNFFYHAESFLYVKKILYNHSIGTGDSQKKFFQKESFEKINKESHLLAQAISDFLKERNVASNYVDIIQHCVSDQFFLFPLVNFEKVNGITKHQILATIFDGRTNEEVASIFCDTKFLTSSTPLREGIFIFIFYIKSLIRRYKGRLL